MTDPKDELQELRRMMVADIMDASDDEILEQFEADIGSPDENAARMQTMFEKAVILVNKSRLQAARAGVAAIKPLKVQQPVQIADARARLRRVLDAHSGDKTFTLAARKESELTDDDVLDMLEVLRELGIEE